MHYCIKFYAEMAVFFILLLCIALNCCRDEKFQLAYVKMC